MSIQPQWEFHALINDADLISKKKLCNKKNLKMVAGWNYYTTQE